MFLSAPSQANVTSTRWTAPSWALATFAKGKSGEGIGGIGSSSADSGDLRADMVDAGNP